MLSEEEKRKLLEIARRSLEESVHGRRLPSFHLDSRTLTSPGAAFVTLKKGGELRGCIGMMEPIEPLYVAVARMARAAALEDPRFPPVAKVELPDIRLDISVLTPLERVLSAEEIEVGKHGLRIERGGLCGVLLPQVAREYNWDRVQFLRQTCRKAGLPEDAWEKGAQVFKFSAEVFGEEPEAGGVDSGTRAP